MEASILALARAPLPLRGKSVGLVVGDRGWTLRGGGDAGGQAAVSRTLPPFPPDVPQVSAQPFPASRCTPRAIAKPGQPYNTSPDALGTLRLVYIVGFAMLLPPDVHRALAI